MSELSVDKITGKTGTGGSNSPLQFSGDTVTLDTGVTIGTGATISASLANATFPAGHIIKSYCVTTNAQTNFAVGAWGDVISVTCDAAQSTSSKFNLFAMGHAGSNNDWLAKWRFYRNAVTGGPTASEIGTAVSHTGNIGATAVDSHYGTGDRQLQNINLMWRDSASWGSGTITYILQVYSGRGTVYINRPHVIGNDAISGSLTTSSFIIQEVA